MTIPCFFSSEMTGSMPGSSGASVIIFTFSKLPEKKENKNNKKKTTEKINNSWYTLCCSTSVPRYVLSRATVSAGVTRVSPHDSPAMLLLQKKKK